MRLVDLPVRWLKLPERGRGLQGLGAAVERRLELHRLELGMDAVPGRQPLRMQPRPELLGGGGEPLLGVVQQLGALGVAGKQALKLGGEPASSVSQRGGHPPAPRGANAGRRSG